MAIGRRQFLSASAAALAAGAICGKPSLVFGQTTAVRRSVNTLAPNDPIIQTYRDAVRRMHELPPTDERSWMGQARIHLDHCHRQFDHFFPWHRFYVAKFEDIIRELTGNNDFAMPYWDWTNNPQMPGIFFGAGNPLNTATWNDPDPQTAPDSARIIGPNDTIPPESVDLRRIENQPRYEVFSDQLEGGPHGAVHIFVGGHMSAFLSPLDPIFYLHHCNVDRLWAKWNTRFSNPTNPAWLNESFSNMFADRSGTLIAGLTTRDALTTAQFGYTYDELVPPGSIAAPASTGIAAYKGDLADAFKNSLANATNTVPSDLNVPLTIPISAAANVMLPSSAFDKKAAQSGSAERQIIARLSQIDIPADADGYRVRVFLNCPYLSPSVKPNDPHYVGEFNLFGLRKGRHGPGHKAQLPSLLFDLTETMVNLNLRGGPVTDRLELQLLPVPAGKAKPRGTKFKVGRVDIVSLATG